MTLYALPVDFSECTIPVPKLSLAGVTGLPFSYISPTSHKCRSSKHQDIWTNIQIKTILNADYLSWQAYGIQVSIIITSSHLCTAYCVLYNRDHLSLTAILMFPFWSSCTKYLTPAWRVGGAYDILKNE